MNKPIIKLAVIIGSLLIIALTLTMTVLALVNNAEAERPKAGFQIFLPEEDICTIAYDGEILWAAGATGLFRVDTKTLVTEEVGDYSYVRSLVFDETGLWAGTDAGLLHMVGTQMDIYTAAEGLPDSRVLCVYPQGDGHFWLGTWGGAVEISWNADLGIQIQNCYTSKNGLLTDNVYVINEDNQQGLWFGSYVAPAGGVSRLKDGQWQYFTTENGLLHANVTAIINRRNQTVAVGSGLYKYGGATILEPQADRFMLRENLTKDNGLAGEKVRSLFEDSQGRLWLGSEYDGLTILDGERITILDKQTGLSQNEVKVISEDKDGNFWIGSLKGLTRIEKGQV